MSLEDNLRKVPPQNLEAESSVLGAIILENEAIKVARGIVKPEDFYRESHSKIFRAMCQLADQREPVDLITLSEFLKSKNELEAVGGTAYLAALADFVPTAVNIASYARIVEDKAKVRRVITVTTEIATRGYEEPGNVEEFLEAAGRGMYAALSNGNGHAADADAEHFVKASTVSPKKLRWLWHSRIPLGKVTVLDGDPGLGKSLLSIEIAACLSQGKPMPNAATADLEPAGAVFLSAEDDTEDTIQPRLVLAGAELDRIAVRKVGDLSMLTIADLDVIRGAVKLVDAKLVVIDPLMAFLPAETNSYRDQDIRRSLAPLAALAADLDVAILVIRHLNKTSNSNPIYRGGGSIGIIGAARSGLMVAKDPDDDSKMILSVAKSNLAKLPASLAYEILSNTAEVPFISWLGPTQHTAASLLHDQADSEEERSAVKDAEEFLTEYLKDLPRKANDVRKARQAIDISEKTLKRAKARLKVWSDKSDFNGEWYWGLPSQSHKGFTKGANNDEGGQSEVS